MVQWMPASGYYALSLYANIFLPAKCKTGRHLLPATDVGSRLQHPLWLQSTFRRPVDLMTMHQQS